MWYSMVKCYNREKEQLFIKLQVNKCSGYKECHMWKRKQTVKGMSMQVCV